MSRFILLAIFGFCITGCEIDDQEKRNKANNALIPATHSLEYGSAVEARAWETKDGSLWIVVGRPDQFAVFCKIPDAKEWELKYSSANKAALPPAVKLQVEASQ